MTKEELVAHIERQMEESAQMGEPPSFAFDNVWEAAQLLSILRREPATNYEDECQKWERKYAIVDRCWKAVGISRYADAGGLAIDQIIVGITDPAWNERDTRNVAEYLAEVEAKRHYAAEESRKETK